MKNWLAKTKRATLVLSALIIINEGAAASENSDARKMFNDAIALEHLEILTPLRGSEYAQGYFYLWNGSAESIYLTSISSSSGQNFLLQKSMLIDGKREWNNVNFPKNIPSKTEFTAKPGLFRILIKTEALPNAGEKKIPILFEFDDQNAIEAYATILPFGNEPTEHHHGLNDD